MPDLKILIYTRKPVRNIDRPDSVFNFMTLQYKNPYKKARVRPARGEERQRY